MNQDLDNSISNNLYYKDDLQLNENGNIKLYKLVIKMIYDILSPSSLLKSSPSSFSTVLNLPSAETFSQSSSSKSLSGTLKAPQTEKSKFYPSFSIYKLKNYLCDHPCFQCLPRPSKQLQAKYHLLNKISS